MTIQEKFEEIINFINWSETTDSEKVMLKLMQKYTPQEIEMVVGFATDLIDELENAIEKYESDGRIKLNVGSDDGMRDVLADIVSKGVDVVEQHIDNPELIEKKYESDDYVENFLNCFPYKDDYDKLNLDYYQRVSEEIRMLVNWDKINQNDSSSLNQILDEFSRGEFKKEYSYDELYEFGDKIDLGPWIANTWTSGTNYYQK
jgi:hypothetical protein